MESNAFYLAKLRFACVPDTPTAQNPGPSLQMRGVLTSENAQTEMTRMP